ncbi:hypothetical protein FPZ24_16240 [Sphingomonas panacisoli]|uniref:DUF2946 domain-containing protein n=1 Tax=Sphingomonas panacisoli TaxID=1813879 RepID=A0A5B8LL72_9SPHN|nr:hypothetical protein [Sphingomonas panacisoli]QDZ08826.1 hypothetical protein FPZ24_16240 [Sphingomonas panacisoli]
MTHSTVSIPTPFAPAARRFALLWLVVALLFQGFVTQTHGHPGFDRAWSATESARAAPTAVDSRKDIPATPACPLCEERALFGAYLLGGSVTIAAPLAAVYHYTTASLPLLAPSVSSHAWQSRAPPIFTA